MKFRHFLSLLASLGLLILFTHNNKHTTTESNINTARVFPIEVSRSSTAHIRIEPQENVEPLATTSTSIKTVVSTSSTIKKKINTTKTSTAAIYSSNATALPAGLLCIRHLESTDNYADNTGNSFYGAFQYTIKTWNNFGGYARADLAPSNIQDQRALRDYNLGYKQIHQNWPNTSKRCGL